jgi:hypothetical protein
MGVKKFGPDEKKSFRVKTSSGTVYTLAVPDDTGLRKIIRFSSQGMSGGTFIMRPIDLKTAKEVSDDNEFVGRVLCDVQVGQPMIIGKGEQAQQRIISDTVVEIIDITR